LRVHTASTFLFNLIQKKFQKSFPCFIIREAFQEGLHYYSFYESGIYFPISQSHAVVQAAAVVAVLAVKAADPAHQVSRARCHNYEWQLIVGIMRKK